VKIFLIVLLISGITRFFFFDAYKYHGPFTNKYLEGK